MMTSRSARGSICLKWILKPWANASVAPFRMLGSISFAVFVSRLMGLPDPRSSVVFVGFQAAGTLGLVLNKLFQRTFSVAKTVRTETDTKILVHLIRVNYKGDFTDAVRDALLRVEGGDVDATGCLTNGADHRFLLSRARRQSGTARHSTAQRCGRAAALSQTARVSSSAATLGACIGKVARP